jgi:hypothetical protein
MKYIILIILISNSIWSQNFEKHQWRERVLVIISDAENLKYSDQQFNLFINEKEKLIDRKIVLYRCFEKKCTFYNWKDKPETFRAGKKYKDFKTLLIGLDGGVKYDTNKVEDAKVYFDLIDTMPMRQGEVKKKNKRND